ncbi:MAG TPA: family 20 glycosylhydrolase, partial [Aggregatilineales bacterium]|nr:family 20 glycosylhydrolase [Aggregatilineales bacterium]
VSPDLLTLSAHTPAGLFRGIQTIRQLLPAAVENAAPQPGPWTIETSVIRDIPRFAWRGFMLDVARHFFGVDEVKRVIDLMAYYKLNHLHLHLSDDQGWRLAISGWPNLTATGGSTQVGGGTGGFYTQDDYSAIVKYAQARYISVVPEIDMPGHTSAALASYPELTCTGVAPGQNTDTIAQSASLCVGKDITYSFVGDVVKELAELTPGPYIHIGGDEPSSTRPTDYLNFVKRVQAIVKTNGKQVIGWQDISQSTLLPDTVIQHWNWDQRSITLQGVQQGAMVILSPVPLGERYAGYVSVQAGYQWEPSLQIKGLTESSILGVEAPLWTEIVRSRADLDRMTYPWLLAYAEIGWSPPTGRNWDEYRARLGTHGPRLTALGVDFFRSAEVSWGQ